MTYTVFHSLKTGKSKFATKIKQLTDYRNTIIQFLINEISKGKPADTAKSFDLDEEKYKRVFRKLGY